VLGGIFALIAAATFALNNATLRRGVLTGTVVQAMAVTVPLGIPLFLIAAVLADQIAILMSFSQPAILALCGAGIVHFVWGRYCNYRATQAIGANLVAPIQQFSLLFSLGLAIWLLGETLTPLRMLGIVLVIIGPAFTLHEAKLQHPSKLKADLPAPASKLPVFSPRYAEGYLFALLSASGYGTSPILVRFALDGKGVGAGLAGGVISYSAATVIVLLFLLVPGQLARIRTMKWESAKWFTISGVFVCVSQMFAYMAMAIAPVSVVIPIQRLSMVFRIYCARLITPDHEVFGPGIIVGTVVSLVGAICLSLSTDIVLSLLPLPANVQDILRTQWP